MNSTIARPFSVAALERLAATAAVLIETADRDGWDPGVRAVLVSTLRNAVSELGELRDRRGTWPEFQDPIADLRDEIAAHVRAADDLGADGVATEPQDRLLRAGAQLLTRWATAPGDRAGWPPTPPRGSAPTGAA